VSEKITYGVLADDARRIQALVVKEKYRNSEEFLDTAVRILLTWESDHPVEIFEIIKRLVPFSPEQDAFMNMVMKPEEKEKHFGVEINPSVDEFHMQKIASATPNDHLELLSNLKNTKEYVSRLEIKKPENIIFYNGYPLLFSFYSRFLPVKIVIAILGNLLRKKNDWKIELRYWRIEAYDYSEEIAEKLVAYERDNDFPRNRKVSTGLPKKGMHKTDEEKKAMAQKRFKDQFVGKIRQGKIIKTEHFEGACAALGLVYAFEEDGKEFVSLTPKGKKFILLNNPILNGDWASGSLSKEESDFIVSELIPQLELENKFFNVALSTVKDYPKLKNEDKKITDLLDVQFHKAANDYKDKHPDATKKYNLNHLDSLKDEMTARKITGWRVATMGRLAELHKVKWEIDGKGDSEFILK